LTSIQKKVLHRWSSDHRYSYNKAIGIINQDIGYNKKITNEWDEIVKEKNKDLKTTDEDWSKKCNPNTFYSKQDLRNMIVPKQCCSRIPWILETPNAIREHAVFEASKNYKSALTNLKNGNIKSFSLGFKSKRNAKWTIGIRKEFITPYGRSVGIYERNTTNFRIKTTEDISKIDHDCTIHFDGLNYYLNVQRDIKVKKNVLYDENNNETNKKWFAALDPGTRKFQTLYSPDENEYIMLGNRAANKMYSNLEKLDFLHSKKANRRNKKSRLKIRKKISNLQAELHYKTSSFLCKNYSNILAPKLTKNNDIINKKRRKIRTTTVRKMVVYAHCKFIERLKTKAEEFTDVKVTEITEEYTSQTCLRCRRNTKTSDELFKCNNCDYKLDRDMLGSTNILLKNW
jgi:putative transposase